METIAVSEFRANLMNVLKSVEQGMEIGITSRGKVIARLLPPENTAENSRKRLEEISKNVIIRDIVSPVETDWNVIEE